MNKLLAVALLFLVGCAGGGGGQSSNQSPVGHAPAAKDQDSQEGTIQICHVAEARTAIGVCLLSRSEQKKAALLATIQSWAFEKDYFYPSDLDRDSFKQRYSLDDDQVSCLVGRTCGVENEDAL